MFESNPQKDRDSREVNRRTFLVGAGLALAGVACWRFEELKVAAVEAAAAARPPEQVTIVDFTDAGARVGAMTVPKIVKTERDWKKQLSPDSFAVTRQADTETPFSGELLHVEDVGVFRCICCDTALFNSNTKFNSGTGWPSFWQPIAPENIVEAADYSFGITRTAVSCRRCDAHLGHVFNDGPPPTQLRYCINSVAMRFAKAS